MRIVLLAVLVVVALTGCLGGSGPTASGDVTASANATHSSTILTTVTTTSSGVSPKRATELALAAEREKLREEFESRRDIVGYGFEQTTTSRRRPSARRTR